MPTRPNSTTSNSSKEMVEVPLKVNLLKKTSSQTNNEKSSHNQSLQKENVEEDFEKNDINELLQAKPNSSTSRRSPSCTKSEISVENNFKIKRPNSISLINDLIYLLENNQHNSDVEIILTREKKGELNKHKDKFRFKLHSFVLIARSKHLKQLLQDKNAVNNRSYAYSFDNKVHTLNLTGFSNVDVFQEFVKFLYTAQCLVNGRTYQGLMFLADLFEIESLKKVINDYLKRKLCSYEKSEGNNNRYQELIEITKVAFKYNLDELKQDCVIYLSKDKNEISQTEAWEELEKGEYLDIVREVLAI